MVEMPTFAFIFGYESPDDVAANAVGGDAEKIGFFKIIAESEDAALAWGKTLAEAYIKRLFAPLEKSWAAGDYAAWIEAGADPELGEALVEAPLIAVGEDADFEESRRLFRD